MLLFFSVKGRDYGIHFSCMSKINEITIRKSSNLNEKSGLLWFFILTMIKKD